jgi:hypothetical protein
LTISPRLRLSALRILQSYETPSKKRVPSGGIEPIVVPTSSHYVEPLQCDTTESDVVRSFVAARQFPSLHQFVIILLRS